MVQKVYEHPTRKISFSVDESKPWTADDESLVNAYLKLHDKETLLKEKGKELMSNCSNLNKHIEKVRVALMDIKTKIAALSKLADGFIVVDISRAKKAAKISEQVTKVNDEVLTYGSLLDKLDEETNNCSALNSAFIDATENFDVWEEYDDIKSKHLNNYETNSVDIVSFDKDDDAFRGFVSIWSDDNKTIIDYANNAIDNYNKLILETEMQYAIWEEFLKRFALIRSIIETNAVDMSVSVN